MPRIRNKTMNEPTVQEMTRKTVRRVGRRRMRRGGVGVGVGAAGGGGIGGSVDIRRGRKVQWGCRSGMIAQPDRNRVREIRECELLYVQTRSRAQIGQTAAELEIPL